MARATVYVPTHLLAAARRELGPGETLSGFLNSALEARLATTCEHPRLVCALCGKDVPAEHMHTG